MKVMYILGALMMTGILLIMFCSVRVLNDMNMPNRLRMRPGGMNPRVKQPAVRPSTQPYVIGTYLGVTFFIVGAIGSMIAVVQVLRREI